MTGSIRAAGVALALLAATATAAADESPRRLENAAQYGGQGWTALGAQTLGGGADALFAQAGYPGLSVGYLRGATPWLDLGGRFTFNYGYEGLVTAAAPGVKGEVVARLTLLDAGPVSLGLNLGAGVLGYFGPYYSVVGVSLPVGLALSLPIASALVVDLSLDAPMFVTFGISGGLTFPLLLGGGVEYFLDKHVALTLDVKMGPALYPTGFRYGSQADFDLQAQLGVAYRL